MWQTVWPPRFDAEALASVPPYWAATCSPTEKQSAAASWTSPLPSSGTYAGAVSTGTFTHGHVGPAALVEVVRILRTGAVAAIGINAAHFSAFDFGPTLEQLVDQGRIDHLRLIQVPIYADVEPRDPDHTGLVAAFTIT